MKRLALLSALFAVNAFATILPENDLWKEDVLEFEENMTEAEFNALIDDAAKHYAPIVEKFGAKLIMNKYWKSSVVNASAQKIGNQWMVNSYGGLARRKEVTKDAFVTVVCHEIAHLVGAFPFYSGSDMATEGQADFYATHVCTRKLWQNQSFEGEVAVHARSQCDSIYKEEAERKICYRSSMAGQSLGNLLAYLSGDKQPQFETPDQKYVNKTYEGHGPSSQCRLDSYFNGALCSKVYDLFSYPKTEEEAYQQSCKSGIGARPRCWFAPKI